MSGPLTVVVMGPSGCGKSTIGRLAAERAGAAFFEADDYHTGAARASMAAGLGLTDDDRRPWIARIGIAVTEAAPPQAVLACSALNVRIREWLSEALPGPTRFALLDVPSDELARRLGTRSGHYAGPSLLPSQLAGLEPSGAVRLDGTRPPEALAAEVARLFAG